MKKIIIICVVVVIFMVGIAVFILSKSKNKTEPSEIVPTPTEALPTINEETKVSLVFGVNNQSIALKISGITQDTETIEYELTYLTGAGLPRGVLGKITVNGEKEVKRDDIVLGTCSSGKCVYDSGVKSVDLSLKFNTPSGSKVFSKSYSL